MLSNSNQEVAISEIMMQIDKGEIKEYNQYQKIPIELWAKHKQRIQNALTYYRERVYMDKDREIKVYFFSGATATGKTTFAKTWCKKLGLSCCVSSSSNDPFQDYKGEDVLILDDMRDTDFKLNDLLKILDNHTKSTSKSRYNNKGFIGSMIIITSCVPLDEWYIRDCVEDKLQLKRRVSTLFKFQDTQVDVFNFNEKTFRYEKAGFFVNDIMFSPVKKVEAVRNKLKDAGITLNVNENDQGKLS